MRTHPMVIIGGILQVNPFFVPPDEFLYRSRIAQPYNLSSTTTRGLDGTAGAETDD